MISKDQLVVVIRSAGERTESVCRELVLREVIESQVHVVRLVPFEAALTQSYKIGIESGSKWLMTLDADVLLRENAISDFMAEAEAMPDDFFHTEGLVYDYLTGMYRKAGHRMYRTSMLNEAIMRIPLPGETIRPEFKTIQRMVESGFPVQETGSVYGIHDFEQFYTDVYRKCVVHATKHSNWLPDLIKRWKAMQNSEADFRVSLQAVTDGLLHFDSVSIDKRIYLERAKKVIEMLGLSEKNETFQIDSPQKKVADTLIYAGKVPVELQSVRTFGVHVSRKSFLKKMISERGLIKTCLYILGVVVINFGKSIRRLSGQ